MKKSVAATLLGALLLLVLPTGTAVASASRFIATEGVHEVVLLDGSGDVWATPVGGDTFTPAPGQRAADVLRAKVAHRQHAFVMRLRLADLGTPAGARMTQELTLKTGSARWFAQVSATRAHPTGRHHLWSGDGNRADCDRMSHDIDYDTGVVRLRIPRSCLDRPRWIRAAVTTQLTTAEQLFVDNPHNHEALPTGSTRRLYRLV